MKWKQGVLNVILYCCGFFCCCFFCNVLGTVRYFWMCLWAFAHTHSGGASGRWKWAQRYSYTQSVMRALRSIYKNVLHSEPSQTHHATAALKYPFQLTVFQLISWATDGRTTGWGFQGPYATSPPARPLGPAKSGHFSCLKGEMHFRVGEVGIPSSSLPLTEGLMCSDVAGRPAWIRDEEQRA